LGGDNNKIIGFTDGLNLVYNDGNELFGSTDTSGQVAVFTRPSGGDYISSKVYQNGTELSPTSNTNPTYTPNLSAADFVVGMGLTGGTPRYMDGLVGEIIIAEDIDTASRQKAEGYLAHKWGLESALPSGHPYKSAAP
jgi:hypothetical protein